MFRRAATTTVAIVATMMAVTAVVADDRTLADVPDPELHELVGDAVQVADTMAKDPEIGGLLQRAEGVFLVPNYGGDDIVHGIRGGHAVALVKREGQWSHPAFYNMGAISVTAEADVEAGPVALILMTGESIEFFKQDRARPVNTDREQPGLVIVPVEEWAQSGEADAVLWSATGDTFDADIINLVDVADNEKANAGYYGTAMEPAAIFSGNVRQAPENVIANSLP